jgi:hypothetical protein
MEGAASDDIGPEASFNTASEPSEAVGEDGGVKRGVEHSDMYARSDRMIAACTVLHCLLLFLLLARRLSPLANL